MHQISGEKLLDCLFDGIYFVDDGCTILYVTHY